MAIIKRNAVKKIQIDLHGPQGNAFYLLGCVNQYGRQLGWSEDRIKQVKDKMKSSNYDHLIRTFDSYFGSVIDLVR